MDTMIKAKERRTRLLDEHPEFLQLVEIKESIKTREINPDEISRAVVKINVLLCGIGEIEAELRSRKEYTESFRRSEFTHLKALASGTVIQRESIAEKGIVASREEENISIYLYEWVRNFREDYRSLAQALQSRLKVLNDEYKNANQT